MKGKRVSIFLNESDKWQHRPLYLELLQTLVRQNVEYAFAIRTLAGFTRVEDMRTKVALLGVSCYQPLIIEFAASIENVERAMTSIAEMTAGVFVVHDWGSALGFNRTFRYPSQVQTIAYMEAILQALVALLIRWIVSPVLPLRTSTAIRSDGYGQ